MSDQTVKQNIETTIEAAVIRCRCGDPTSHEGPHCPKGERVPLGVIAYHHTDPRKNVIGKARVWLNSFRNRSIRLGR